MEREVRRERESVCERDAWEERVETVGKESEKERE